MSAEKLIRSQGREILKNNYLKAISGLLVLFLVFYLVYGVYTLIDSILYVFEDSLGNINIDLFAYLISFPINIVMLLFLSPFINGYIRMYYRAAYRNTFDINDMYYYFKHGPYGRALRINIGFFFRMLLPTVICFLPVTAYLILVEVFFTGFGETNVFDIFLLILNILSVMLTVLWSLKYFTVYTLAVENEEMGANQLFRASKRIMRSNTGKSAKLIFSFTPWMLLCFTVLPIIYVVPYMTESLCVCAKWITQASFEGNSEK